MKRKGACRVQKRIDDREAPTPEDVDFVTTLHGEEQISFVY